jgi:hypothetical protein
MKALLFIGLLSTITACGSVGNRLPASTNEGRLELYQVGEIKTSLLGPSEFTDRYGRAWVLMDGRSIVGSDYSALTGATQLPDARGKFLRMLNAGAIGDQFDPEANRHAGSYQTDELKAHKHSYTDRWGAENGHGQRIHLGTSTYKTTNFSTNNTGGAETRPKNIAVYFYVKVNSCEKSDDVCL